MLVVNNLTAIASKTTSNIIYINRIYIIIHHFHFIFRIANAFIRGFGRSGYLKTETFLNSLKKVI